MHARHVLPLAALLLQLTPALPAHSQPAAGPPLPAIPQLMREVEEHQKMLEKVRENYTYTESQVTQDIDAKGQVTKTESRELEVFFVHSRQIDRLVKKDGKPLDERELRKETERVTRAVENAEKPARRSPRREVSQPSFNCWR